MIQTPQLRRSAFVIFSAAFASVAKPVRVAALIAVSLWSFELSAQTPPASQRNALLEALAGRWRMEGNVRGKPVAYDLEAQRVLDGRYIELHMKDIARPAQYEARVFIGEDTVVNRVIVHWLDSFGAAYSIPYGEGTAAGDTLQFAIPYPGAPFRDTFVFRSMDHTWLFRLESSDGHGGWKLFAEYVVRKN